MIKTDDIFEIAKRQFFIDKFVPKLEEWKDANKGKGGTQKAFASLIGVTENMIGQYKTGDAYPNEKRLKRIISALGVPDDYFTPKTQSELFQYSPEYVSNIGSNKIAPYCEEIGLNTQFLQTVRSLIGDDLGDQFPFWTPIMQRMTLDTHNSYSRPDPVEFWNNSAEMKPEVKMFQIEVPAKDDSGNKRLTLTSPDLLFLRDVQEEVVNYVEFLFYKRKKELKEECEEASRKALIPLQNGGSGTKPLSADELNEIDKYYSDYVDSRVRIEIKKRRK